MSLQLSINKSISNYSILTLIDSTGDYDAVDNLGGWGSPNITLNQVLYAFIKIVSPKGTIYSIDIINQLGIDFNTIISDELVYNIPSSMLGRDTNDVLEDGIYTIEYLISDKTDWEEGDPVIKFNLATYFEVQRDVFKNVALIPDIYMCERCCTLKLKDIIGQHMMLQSLILASKYSYLIEFNNILETLKQIVSFDTDLICKC